MSEYHKPREKARIYGVEKLSDVELLAVILGSGSKKQSVLELASELIQKYNGFTHLFVQEKVELVRNDGIGEVKAVQICAIFELHKRLLKQEKTIVKAQIIKPVDLFRVVQNYAYKSQESMILLCVNTRNVLISEQVVFIGSLNSVAIHPREIFKIAISQTASKIFIAHNHPSGDTEPSIEDLDVTKRLVKVSKLVGIELIDHIVFSQTDFVSIRELEPDIFL
ncbi:MAG: RadC family protein [Mycoplasmatales bacterium]